MSKQNPTRPYKGLETGTSPLDQPKGSYTMAWNAVNETVDGNNNFISNEQSNSLCGNITEGYTPIGDVYVSDGNTVVFSTNGTTSQIGIIDSECQYSLIVESNCLGFKVENQIDATFRVRRGCERTIYFTDGINPVRYFNLDKVDEFKDSSDLFEDCKKFNLFLEFKNPCFTDFEILEQGVLESGTYSFALQYLDKDLNPTKWTHVTQPVPIYNSLLSSPYGEIIGSSNTESDSLGGSGSNTTKAIKLTLNNLDQSFEFYRIGVIERTSFTGNVTRTLVSFEIPIRQTEFLYTGNIEGYTEININEIRIQPIQIDSAEHIEQLENRLILANTKSKQVDFCSYQSFASQITSEYVVSPAPAEELSTAEGAGIGNSKDPDTYWFKRGYMGDEVYAFGIVYVFEDGYESPAYHIPGRGKDCLPCSGTILINETVKCVRVTIQGILQPGCSVDYSFQYTYTPSGGSPTTVTVSNNTSSLPFVSEIFCASSENDTLVIASSLSTTLVGTCSSSEVVFSTVELVDKIIQTPQSCAESYYPVPQLDSEEIYPWEDNIAHIYPDSAVYNALPIGSRLQKWQVYNTAYYINSTSGHMAYWESPSATYTNILDCNGGNYWGTDNCGNSLAGTPVRHHKFPDRNLVPHIVNNSTTPRYESTLIVQVDFTNSTTELESMFGNPSPGQNPSLPLTINYDLDGVAQAAEIIDIFFNDFVFDTATGVYLPVQRTIITKFGVGISGITNVVFSNTVATDPDTTVTNISTINNQEVSPNTDIDLNVLGIKFSNITYPSSDIVGHYIVRGDRDTFNRTIIQKGISNSTHEATSKGINYNIFSYFAGGPTLSGSGAHSGVIDQSSTVNYLFTPSALFQNDPPKGRYLKQEQRFLNIANNGVGNLSTPQEFDNLTEFGAGVGKSAVFGAAYATTSSSRKLSYGGLLTSPPSVVLRGIEKSLFLDGLSKDTSFINNKVVYNISHTNRAHILKLENGSIKSDGSRHIPYVSVKTDNDIHPNLFSIQYYRTHNCVITNATDNTVFGGDTFIAPMNLSNTLFFKFTDSVWDAVLYISIIVIATVATVFSAGAAAPGIASAIGALTGTAVTSGLIAATTTGIIVTAIVAGSIGVTATKIDQAIKSMRESGLQDLTTADTEMNTYSATTKNSQQYANEHIEGIFVETEINLGLRQEHTIYAPGDFFKGGSKDLREYFRDRIVVFDEEAEAKKDQWVHRGLVVPEVYHYNPDFSVFNKDNVYTPLPESYDCCSNCLETFPTRVSYSEQSFQEESVDNFRIFLANNYRDIEAEKGSITNIFRKHNNLFVHTEEALWQLPQNIQERVTGDLISFIGTGSYFSIPPRLINDDEIGSAGSKHKWATIKTDVGVFFIDESNRDVFLMTTNQGIQAISNKGIKNFFKENMINFLEQQYSSLLSKEFANKNNPANPNGVGYSVTQDTRHERIIFTKRDYKILPAYTSSFAEVTSVGGAITGIVNDQLFFDTTTKKFGIGTGVNTFNYVSLSDSNYFENKSWTLSYSLISQSWISFHSYIPLYYIYIHNNFYSFSNNQIWKHNTLGSYQNFYGVRYPHILEYVSLSSPVITRLWDEILLQTIARTYNVTTKQFIDKRFVTFNKAIFYNSRQTTGLLNLIVKDDEAANYLVQQIMNTAGNQIKINRDERNWTINEIRDYRTDYNNSIWSKDWDSIKNEYPIDKVLNTSTIDFSKTWYDLQVLRDKYLIIRLIFDNLDDVNLITNYSFERETPSNR